MGNFFDDDTLRVKTIANYIMLQKLKLQKPHLNKHFTTQFNQPMITK